MTDSIASQPAPSRTFVPVCPLCCEDKDDSIVLSACLHPSCRSCLATWIERNEASGQTTPPACPFCRKTISNENVIEIMGRPFQPRESLASSETIADEQTDQLTLDWINEHTVACKACGSQIEKESGTCDLMECLCGYRFCYNCGAADGSCNCTPGHIFDNDDFELNDRAENTEPIRDSRGIVDIGSCIRRREIREERMERRLEKEEEVDENYLLSERNPLLCTTNGRWIFSPKQNNRSITILSQQISHDRIQEGRNPYLWGMFIWPDAPDLELCPSWLFLRKGTEIRALQQFLAKADVQFERTSLRRSAGDQPKSSLDISWLFKPRGQEIDCMKHSSGICKADCPICTKQNEEQCLKCILFVFPSL